MESFTDLVLLIGTNPLPNYVVAKHFLENEPSLKRIWLVHSEKTRYQAGTDIQAENLEKVLQEQYKIAKKELFPLQKVALSNVSNAQLISQNIKEKLISELLRDSSVHLNYTGGTKSMGIHVYRAIEQEDTKCLSKSYSYLDGRNFRIVYDNGKTIMDDLRSKISIGFEMLIKLHGFKRNNTYPNVDFSPAIEIFKKLTNEGRLDEYFKENVGYNRTLFENKEKPGDLAKQVSKLKEEELRAFQPNDVFLSVINAMPPGYQFFTADKNFVEPTNNNICEHAIKFLDGGWFEEYVYNIFNSALEKPKYKIYKNWRIDKEGWSTDFELDVIILRGYQLIGVSCTTSAYKSECKNKGFEIIHRTGQIGGDEAKAILVTGLCSTQKDTLQEELTVETGSTSANILVLGKDDWEEAILKREINHFLEG